MWPEGLPAGKGSDDGRSFCHRGKMELGAWVGDEDFLNHKHTKNTKVGEERPGVWPVVRWKASLKRVE